MTKIKICGLTRIQDIEAVNNARPDYIGFVFASSRRQISESTAKELKAELASSIKAVGVFVNEQSETIIRLCKDKVIDIIQLHGDETETDIRLLRKTVPNPIVKAVRVRDREDIIKASQLSCDYLLFDSYKKDQYGGSGDTFDWSMISMIDKPYFLAGGIHIDNAAQAITRLHPYCLDVSSGVETDSFKDGKKIYEMVHLVREISEPIG